MRNRRIDRVPFLATQYRTCIEHRKTTARLEQSWVSISKSDADTLSTLTSKNDLMFAQLNAQIDKLSPEDKARFDKLVADCV